MREPGMGPTLKDALADYERRLIRAALERHGGHQRRAAAALGVLPSTLVEKMKRLGIPGARRGRESGQVVAFFPGALPQRLAR